MINPTKIGVVIAKTKDPPKTQEVSTKARLLEDTEAHNSFVKMLLENVRQEKDSD